MARMRRWGRQQIEESLAGLDDLTRRLNGETVSPPAEGSAAPAAATRPRSQVEEQLEGLAELAAELDLGLPGTNALSPRATASPPAAVPPAAAASPKGAPPGPAAPSEPAKEPSTAQPPGANGAAPARFVPLEPGGARREPDPSPSPPPPSPAPSAEFVLLQPAPAPGATDGEVAAVEGPASGVAVAGSTLAPPRSRGLSEPAPGVLIPSRPAVAGAAVGGRPWSLAAAMEPLPPLAPPPPPPRVLPPGLDAASSLVTEPAEGRDDPAGRRPVVLGAAILLLALLLGGLLLVAHQRRPIAPEPAPRAGVVAPAAMGFVVDRLRTVSAGAGDPFAAPAQASFPEGTTAIVVDVTYHGASPGTPLGISLARAGGPGQPVAAVLDSSYILNPGRNGQGQNAIVIATPLSLGHYVLSASYSGKAVYTGGFDVVAAAAPTPRRR